MTFGNAAWGSQDEVSEQIFNAYVVKLKLDKSGFTFTDLVRGACS